MGYIEPYASQAPYMIAIGECSKQDLSYVQTSAKKRRLQPRIARVVATAAVS